MAEEHDSEEVEKPPMSKRARWFLFGGILVLLAVVVVGGIYVADFANQTDEQATEETNTSNDDTTQLPDAIETNEGRAPDTLEEFDAINQQKIIDESLKEEEEHTDHEITHGPLQNFENDAELGQQAREAVMAWCTIEPDESSAARTERVAPHFTGKQPSLDNPLIAKRSCSVEAVGHVLDRSDEEEGKATVSVGVAWVTWGDASKNKAENGYTQYTVEFKNGGIVDIYA